MPFDAQVDIIFIFDCCYSFLATRTPKFESRIFAYKHGQVSMDAIFGKNPPLNSFQKSTA